MICSIIPMDKQLKRLTEEFLSSATTLNEKALALMGIKVRLDEIVPLEEHDRQYYLLPECIQTLYDTLWEKMIVPKSHGRWYGEEGNSLWIPDDDYCPPNKSYSNVSGLSWAQIKAKYGIKGIRYQNYLPCFEDIQAESVTVDYAKSGFDRYSGGDSSLHELAFAALSKKKGWSKEEAYAFKEDRAHDWPIKKPLVWHELPDCKTMILVPQEIHGNIPHFGGIAMASLIC